MTRLQILFVSLAAFVFSGATDARAVQFPITLTVTDGTETRSTQLEGEFVPEHGDWQHDGLLESPTFRLSWLGDALFEGATGANYAGAIFDLTNLTSQTQDYVIELSIDTNNVVGGTNVFARVGGGPVGSEIVDAHRGGLPMLSLMTNGIPFVSTEPIESPINELANFYRYLPPAEFGQSSMPTILFEPDLHEIGFRLAFSLSPGGTSRLGTDVAGTAVIPEPSGTALVWIAIGMLGQLSRWRRC